MSAASRRGLRRGLWLCAGLVAAAALSIGACSRHAPPAGDNAAVPEKPSAIGGPFRLVDTTGRTVTDQSLKGRPYAIFFGFTRCPDACPTTMSRLALLRQRLGPDADRIAILFVSVDPEHDKPADIASFLSMFDTPVTGLTGSPAAIRQIQQAFRVVVEHVPLPNGDYTIDHSTAVYLMDRHGRFFEPMSATDSVEANLGQLHALLRI